MRTSRGAIVGAIATSLIAVLPALPVAAAPSVPQAASALAAVDRGTFTPVPPSRILDTREGIGAPKAPVGAGASIDLQVTGRGGLPATGVMAVVLNVTVHMPTTNGHVTVWPTGVAKPVASSLNFYPGWVGANSVTVAVGTGGKVSLFNSNGQTHFIADVVGWYADSTATTAGSLLVPAGPERLYDSREDPAGKFLPGEWITLLIDYEGIDPASIKAWAVNVTSTDAETAGYITVWNGDNNRPFVSTLNLVPGRTVPNMAIVPARPCTGTSEQCGGHPGWSSIGLFSSGVTHLIVDIVAIFDGVTEDGLRFEGITPTRIVDSRDSLGTPGPLGQATTATITTPPALVDETTFGLALNVTAIEPTGNTFMTVWPNGIEQPFVSNLNPSAGQIVPNAVITGTDDDHKFNVYNNGGTVHFLVDVVGRFYFLPPDVSGASARADGARSLARVPVGTQAVRH